MPDLMIDFDALREDGFELAEYSAEEKMFQTGETGHCLFLARSGSVRIVSFGTIL